MRHRLFIAVNITDAARREVRKLSEEAEKKFAPDLLRQIRLVPSANWHLTMSFLGYEDDAEFPKIMRAAGAAAKRFPAQEIIFDTVTYGPPRGSAKRMLWLGAAEESSQKLSTIKEFLEDRLVAEQVPFMRETRPFGGHITLARFNGEMRGATLPPLGRSPRICVPVESLDLMESTLRREGAEYAILQKFPFSKM
ncbi:MAG: RNA 2',3'-cyclic phosphodiesterase [Minisyncoccia bacterium]